MQILKRPSALWSELSRLRTLLNLRHFSERAFQSANRPEKNLSVAEFQELLKTRIVNLDVRQAKEDIHKFINNSEELNIWSQNYFLQLSQMLKIQG